jgi:hypothetical protein
MYRDNTTSTLIPQDGNSLAVWFEIAATQEQGSRISKGLQKNWNEFGAVAPEVSPPQALLVCGIQTDCFQLVTRDDFDLYLWI